MLAQNDNDGITFGSLSFKTSTLVKSKMTDVRRNHREFMILSNKTNDSSIRF